MILCAAVSLLMLALTAIGASSDHAHRRREQANRTPWQVAFALVPLAIIPAGASLPLVALVGILTACCWAQMLVATS